MLRSGFIALFLALPLLGAVNTRDTAQQVRQLEARRIDAMVHRDFSILQRLLSDNLTYVHTTGAMDTKRSLLAALQRGDLTYLHFPVTQVQLRLYRDTAVFTGRAMPEPQLRNNPPLHLNIRFSDVWIRTPAHGWQMVAWQSTLVR